LQAGSNGWVKERWSEALDALFLYGQYEVSVDPKNRMLVPAGIRRRIKPESHGHDFYLTLGPNRRPWLYPDKFFEALHTQKQSDETPGAEQTDYDRMTFAMAQLVELDTQGRVLIPVRSMAYMGLTATKDFYLLGVRDHLELWNKADWEKDRETMLARSPDITAAARAARKSQ
jgi:MraZ protein